MTSNRPWREVKDEKRRRDAERGRTPIRAHQHAPGELCDETCHDLADRFIYTRGPHEGQLIPTCGHSCVPECYEDQSHRLDDPSATYVAEPGPQLVQAASITTVDSDGRSHVSVELRLLVHPSVNVDDLKLRLVADVVRIDRELQEVSDGDR